MTSVNTVFEQNTRVIIEEQGQALPSEMVFRMVNIPTIQDDKGRKIRKMLSAKMIPSFFSAYTGKNGVRVPNTQFRGLKNSRQVSTQHGNTVWDISNVPIRSEFFVLEKHERDYFNFLMQHPLNLSNPNLTETMRAEALADPCCFELIVGELESEKNALAERIRAEVNNIIKDRAVNPQPFISLCAWVGNRESKKEKEVIDNYNTQILGRLGYGTGILQDALYFQDYFEPEFSDKQGNLMQDFIDGKKIKKQQNFVVEESLEMPKEELRLIWLNQNLFLPLCNGAITIKSGKGCFEIMSAGQIVPIPYAVLSKEPKDAITALIGYINRPSFMSAVKRSENKNREVWNKQEVKILAALKSFGINIEKAKTIASESIIE